MSKMKQHVQNWLDDIGYSLGYHDSMMPDIAHLDIVKENAIQVWEYFGYKTERGFYSHTGKVKPYRSIKEVIEQYGMDKKKYWEKDELGGIIL
tara:strand:+ start:1690 stop:1968 length:279 start_codon:yes stop_codon:yes gene_type:complete